MIRLLKKGICIPSLFWVHLRTRQRNVQSARCATLTVAFLSAFLCTSSFAVAQTATGSLHGMTTAINPEGQSFPVGGVAIKLTGNTPGLPSVSAYSDDGGNYEFTRLPAGSYTLVATIQGFKPTTRQVVISASQATVENIEMKFETLRQQIEVREKAPLLSTEGTAPPTVTLQTKQISILPVTQHELKQELPVTPGVVKLLSGKVYIKGVPENQSMLLLDSAEAVNPVTGAYSINVPVNAIQSLQVYKAPFGAQYGGFVGGLTSINLKPPPGQWHLTMHHLNPALRGKEGDLVGFSRATPRMRFGGPIWKHKVNFAESFLYDMRKVDVRGLAWPNDETYIEGYNSITNFQFMLSPRNYASLSVNLFPRHVMWANLNVLIPRPAAVDDGQRGFSVDGTDTYQFGSGGILHTLFKVLNMDTYAHGNGPKDMLLTPTGIRGNYFNAWTRESRMEEGQSIYRFPAKDWLGKQEFLVGTDIIHRGFTGVTQSHPVLILRNDGSAAERIDFSGPGNLNANNTSIVGFGQDHWIINNRLATTLGVRYDGETNGGAVNFAPRLGMVLALNQSASTVLSGGIGMFYDRTPLLAGDFIDNPTRTVTPLGLTGLPVGPSVAYQNTCARISSGIPQALPNCSDLDSTPYNLTWRVQLSHRFSRTLSAKISTLYSHSTRLFTIDPISQPDSKGLMLLSNRGSSRYHEYEFTVNYRPDENADVSLSYVRSSSRGDLNTVGSVFVPFEDPLIRPDVYANLPSDIPNRLTGYGMIKLPWGITLSPSVDLHSGFPYSNVDVLDNYVKEEKPNTHRYPIYFSLNWAVYKDFPLPFHIHPGHKFRLGIWSVNTTGRHNPTAVYNNITSPYFGQFTGLGKRINGFVIGFAD